MVERRKVIDRLADEDYRAGLVEAEIANGVAFQLRAMLRERGWTQQTLAEYAGTAQPLISKYLNGYENYNLQTLKRLASAFDVGLIVSFAPFSEILDRYVTRSYASIAIPSYANDRRVHEPSGLISTRTVDDQVRRFDLTARHLSLLSNDSTSAKIVYLSQVRQERRGIISGTVTERSYGKARA